LISKKILAILKPNISHACLIEPTYIETLLSEIDDFYTKNVYIGVDFMELRFNPKVSDKFSSKHQSQKLIRKYFVLNSTIYWQLKSMNPNIYKKYLLNPVYFFL
jgi:hypothetical protein